MREHKFTFLQVTWRYFDMMIAVGAVAIGLAVWFIPSFKHSPKMEALYEASSERKERRLAREAEEARIAAEREELGIVYLPKMYEPDEPLPSAQPAPK